MRRTARLLLYVALMLGALLLLSGCGEGTEAKFPWGAEDLAELWEDFTLHPTLTTSYVLTRTYFDQPPDGTPVTTYKTATVPETVARILSTLGEQSLRFKRLSSQQALALSSMNCMELSSISALEPSHRLRLQLYPDGSIVLTDASAGDDRYLATADPAIYQEMGAVFDTLPVANGLWTGVPTSEAEMKTQWWSIIQGVTQTASLDLHITQLTSEGETSTTRITLTEQATIQALLSNALDRSASLGILSNATRLDPDAYIAETGGTADLYLKDSFGNVYLVLRMHESGEIYVLQQLSDGSYQCAYRIESACSYSLLLYLARHLTSPGSSLSGDELAQVLILWSSMLDPDSSTVSTVSITKSRPGNISVTEIDYVSVTDISSVISILATLRDASAQFDQADNGGLKDGNTTYALTLYDGTGSLLLQIHANPSTWECYVWLYSDKAYGPWSIVGGLTSRDIQALYEQYQ